MSDSSAREASPGGAAASGLAEAIKVSGAIVKLEPNDFSSLVSRITNPLIVVSEGGLLKKHYSYLVGYKGLVFTTKSDTALQLPSAAELIRAKQINVPY